MRGELMCVDKSAFGAVVGTVWDAAQAKTQTGLALLYSVAHPNLIHFGPGWIMFPSGAIRFKEPKFSMRSYFASKAVLKCAAPEKGRTYGLHADMEIFELEINAPHIPQTNLI